jgi:cardiolipin synthase
MWTAANVVTLGRILLIAPFLYLIRQGNFGWALVVFIVASITDFLDGFLARRLGQQTELGRLLDPIADKLLTTAAFVVMALPHEGFPSIPVWLAVAVVLRDVVILAGSLILYLLTGFTKFKPTLLGKLNTALELLMITVFLTFNSFRISNSIFPTLYTIVLISILLSGAGYLIEGIRIVRTGRGSAREAVGSRQYLE